MAKNHPTIGHGPGNNPKTGAYTEIRQYRAQSAITLGHAVAFVDATAVAALNTAAASAGTPEDYYNGTCVASADLDANNPTLGYAIGIACEAATAAGQWIDVCVAGLCPVAVVTDQSVEEGDVLIPTTAAGVVGGTAGETQDLLGFAIALSDDSTASLPADRCIVMKRI